MRHYEIVFIVHPDQSEQVSAMVERYKTLNIEATPATLEELETGFRFNAAILRHLTIQKKTAITEASPMMQGEKSKNLLDGSASAAKETAES